jgi:hypothetical protein
VAGVRGKQSPLCRFPSWVCDTLRGLELEVQMSFAEFWPEYVRAHSDPATRGLHFVGTLVGWGMLVAAIVTRHWWWIMLALVVPYALAWIGHFFVEHNRPATFEHPLWSWWADQKMVAMMMAGKMGEEVKKAVARGE